MNTRGQIALHVQENKDGKKEINSLIGQIALLALIFLVALLSRILAS